ncbi:substrate-binding periplasmic protein [Thalassotalea sp. PLHSN55]|uniref:substrate-binding periplasmic protein n=1 Tax=Thalassotalea sp. PLHSN55 TaxID=3435888 RepID=UPI003F84DC72
MLRIFIICFYLIFVSFAQANNKPVLTVVSEEWLGVTNADGTGTYWDIIKAVYSDSYQLKLKTMPWPRAMSLVEKGKADILVGVYANNGGHLLFSNQHIDTEYPVYFLHDNQNIRVRHVDELANKLVAGRRGWGLEKHLPSSTSFYGVDDIRNISRLIANKRIDGALTYSYNLHLADPKSSLATVELIPAMPLHIAFSPNEQGHRLKAIFEQQMPKLLENDLLKHFFASPEDYHHANLIDAAATRKQVNWHVISKTFNKNTKKLEAMPWEVFTSEYIASQVNEFKFDLKINNYKETKKQLLQTPGSCAINVRKPEQLNNNILYSNAFHAFLAPRLFIAKDSLLENQISALLADGKLNIMQLLRHHVTLRLAVKDSFGLENNVRELVGSELSNRIITVDKKNYDRLSNMLVQQRIDALIVLPALLDSESNLLGTEPLTSYALKPALGKTLLTYIACSNDDVGRQVIKAINNLLSDEKHQKAIYMPRIKQMEAQTAKVYEKILKLTLLPQ